MMRTSDSGSADHRPGRGVMSAANEHRDLGMNRRIPRRDFLNGVAVGIVGFGVHGTEFRVAGSGVLSSEFPVQSSAAEYPPRLTGLRGNYPDSVETFGPIAQGVYR